MSEQAGRPAIQKASPVTLFFNIITDPEAAFKYLKNFPSWIFPIVLSLLLGLAYMASTGDIQLKMQKDFILNSERIPEASKDKMLENLENPSFFQKTVVPTLSVVLGTVAVPVIIALVLLLFGNFVFGGGSNFKVMFSAVAWAGIIGFIEGVIKLPLVISKGSLEIYTSLALLMDLDQSKTLLFQVLNLVDVFAIWKIFVYATAFAVVYQFSKGKSYITVISLYLVASIIGIGFTQIFT